MFCIFASGVKQSKPIIYDMADTTVKVGENPKLEKKKTSDGNYSLYLNYYLGYRKETDPATGETKTKYHRRKEFLHLNILANPRTPLERLSNRETLELAKKIRDERERELKESLYGYEMRRRDRDTDFVAFFQSYISAYTKKDVRMVKLALSRFVDFLRDTPEYSKYSGGIKPVQIDRDMIAAYVEYLQHRSRGEGAATIYKRFKKVVKYAVEHDIMLKDPCSGISIKTDIHQLKKAVLSPDEIRRLIGTPPTPKENVNVRNAFIFCLYTGLRFCDVQRLTFGNVDTTNGLLSFEQSKTSGHSTRSGVVVPLKADMLRLVEAQRTAGKGRESLIFPLPSYCECLQKLKEWVRRAGIDKNISWHCARHSFATIVLNGGTNIANVAALLGHSSLQHTQKYLRATHSLLREAVESLPKLEGMDTP